MQASLVGNRLAKSMALTPENMGKRFDTKIVGKKVQAGRKTPFFASEILNSIS